MTAPALLWLRRDLRLADHPALLRAREAAGPVVPVFVTDPRLSTDAGRPRQAFLAGALADLRERTGGALTVLHGDPRTVIPAAAAHVRAGSVHVSTESTPYGRDRDEAVAQALGEDVEWTATGSPYAVTPGRVVKTGGEPYRVFTPFWRAWQARGWRDPAHGVRSVDWQAYDGPHRGDLPTADPDAAIPTPTEAAALKAWRTFRDERVHDYASERNDAAADMTSRLSPYLHLGLIHPRTLLHESAELRGKGVEAWRRQLCWREFYADVLWHNPRSAWENYDRRFDGLTWETGAAAKQAFECWQRGQTGFPLVDAGMRQLLAEGWMHNRVRLVTASFLVKDLHCPWQWGARHFLDHLVDGDLANNNHGWQWATGSGTDASPYVRVFNPMLQADKYDPSGDYVRRWVPELRRLAGKAAHSPWDHGGADGYPERMLDHAAERQDALARYEAVRVR